MKRLLLKSLLSCAALLAICAPASATITWLGCVSNPADDAAQSDGSTTPSTAVAVDPSSLSMQSGDTAIIFGYTRQLSSTRHVSIVNAGGQTWTETEPTLADQATGGIPHFARATFNGTWSANPSVQVDVGTGGALGLVLCGIRPSGNPLAVDQALAFTVYSAPSTPFTVTRVGQTPTNASSITIATFWSIDNNTWDSLTGGWTDGGTKRNSQGTGYSIKPVYKIQSSAAATGSVSANQATLGGDAGFTSVITFSETVPTFDSGPTVTALDDNTYRVTYDADAVAQRIFCGAWVKDATAPTAAQIEAGTGAHGTGTENTTGSSDTLDFNVTDNPAYPIYDVYCALEEGTSNYSSVGTQADELLAGSWIAITSIGSGSPCEAFNAAVTPDMDGTDYILPPATTSPSSLPLTVSAACQFSYGDDPSRQLALNIPVYDTSAGGIHASDIDAVFNDPDPNCGAPFNQVIVVNAAMTGIDLDDYCSHPLGDAMTYAKTSGTYPTGVTLTTDTVGGTPTVENEAGTELIFTGTSLYGGTATQTITLYPITTWTLTDCTTDPLDAASCAGLIEGLTLGTSEVSSTYDCSTTVDPNYVISQNPAASAEIAPFTAVDLVVARGCGGGRFGFPTFRFGE